MKQIVVIKESITTISTSKNYLIIKKSGCSDNIIAYRYIEKLYVNKLINISIRECLKLAALFEIYFIDQYGNILGRIDLNEKI